MKNNKYIIRDRYYLLFILFTVLFSSCKKGHEEQTFVGEPGKLFFSVSGVIESEPTHGKIASATYGQGMKGADVVLPTVSLNSIDLDIISETQTMASILDGSASDRIVGLPHKLGSKIASTSTMSSGKTYRILLYNTTSKQVEQSILAKVGETVEVNAVKGQEYKYLAYSYNNTEDIVNPDFGTLTLETPTDKDLLYASGLVNTSVANAPIAILFKHKLAQVVVELDTDRLYGNITNIDISFSSTNYLNKGVFSLLNDTTMSIVTYTKDIKFTEVDSTQANVKLARFYVADPSLLTSFSVQIKAMDAKFKNNKDSVLIAPGDTRVIEFTPFSPSLGKKMVGKLKLWYRFKKLNILHVTGSNDYSYAAQPTNLAVGGSTYNATATANKASFNMINAARNFGELSNSVVRTKGFGHRRVNDGGRIDTALHLNDNRIPSPDIVIIATEYRMSTVNTNNPTLFPGDAEALAEYVNRGGVVFLMSDGVNDKYKSHLLFFQKLFNYTGIESISTHFGGGSMYELKKEVNDDITNGPFGDVRGKHWGEDATNTISMQYVPFNDITVYTTAWPSNRTQDPQIGATMLRHNTKHLFWVGDGGFLAVDLSSGAHGSPDPGRTNWGSSNNQPFAVATAPNIAKYYPYPYLEDEYYEFYPVPRQYGYTGNGVAQFALGAYNSTIFGNFMSWAVVSASFTGINTGGLQSK